MEGKGKKKDKNDTYDLQFQDRMNELVTLLGYDAKY